MSIRVAAAGPIWEATCRICFRNDQSRNEDEHSRQIDQKLGIAVNTMKSFTRETVSPWSENFPVIDDVTDDNFTLESVILDEDEFGKT